MKLRIGTRGSDLALWQARWVAARLTEATGEEPELVIVSTQGDRDRTSELASFGGAGAFTKALDDAQLRGDFEISVHSLKDLPTAMPDGLVLGAVPERAPVEDCLVSRGGVKLDDLPAGARVGTGSPRRAAQLKRLRPDIEVVGIRGNVPTRVEKALSGELDAVMLARAGLERLGLGDAISEVLDVDSMVPAAAQGALGIVVREDAAEARSVLATLLDHRGSRVAVEVERSVMARLGAGCHAPIGVYTRAMRQPGGTWAIETRVRLASPDGNRVVEGREEGPMRAELLAADGDTLYALAAEAGASHAATLRECGAEELL